MTKVSHTVFIFFINKKNRTLIILNGSLFCWSLNSNRLLYTFIKDNYYNSRKSKYIKIIIKKYIFTSQEVQYLLISKHN